MDLRMTRRTTRSEMIVSDFSNDEDPDPVALAPG